MKRTRLEPFEVQSLTNTRECLIENVVCRWLEHLDENYIQRSEHSTMAPHEEEEEEECANAKEEKRTALGPADDKPNSPPTIERGRGSDGVYDNHPQPPYYLSTAHKGHAMLFLHDFGLLHAAAMFNEPSMLADAIELRLNVSAHGEESSWENTCTSQRQTPLAKEETPPMSIFAKHVHTLWVVTGLADFWAGTEDGEHYTCVVIRVRNKCAMEWLKSTTHSGEERDRRVQDDGPPLTSYPSEGSQSSPPSASVLRENDREDSSAASLGGAARCGSSVYGLTPSSCHPTPLSEGSDNAFPSAPIPTNAPAAANHTEYGGGNNNSIVEVFSFDSSGDKRALLPSRLARLVVNALALSPSLKNWFAEARGVPSSTSETTLAPEVCVGNVPVWAWRHSPRQMSAVGCGVFMCAHLEALAKIWCNDRGDVQPFCVGNNYVGVKRERDPTGDGSNGNSGVRAVMPSLEELARAIRAHHDHRPTTLLRIGEDLSSPTRVLTSSTAVRGQEQDGAATAGERYLALFYELGTGPTFEPAYRKYMAKALGY